ncbi:hypothetical protein HBB16_19430 [Pseudonocardia sp. MCCB 268]|nr:hypothetical protein [Pseudonocardia cytotoxica]
MLGREDYAARKQDKITYYRDEGNALIEWGHPWPTPDLGRRGDGSFRTLAELIAGARRSPWSREFPPAVAGAGKPLLRSRLKAPAWRRAIPAGEPQARVLPLPWSTRRAGDAHPGALSAIASACSAASSWRAAISAHECACGARVGHFTGEALGRHPLVGQLILRASRLRLAARSRSSGRSRRRAAAV